MFTMYKSAGARYSFGSSDMYPPLAAMYKSAGARYSFGSSDMYPPWLYLYATFFLNVLMKSITGFCITSSSSMAITELQIQAVDWLESNLTPKIRLM